MNAAQIQNAQVEAQLRQLQLQQVQQENSLNLSGILGTAANDPTLATYAALSGVATPGATPQPQGVAPSGASPSVSPGGASGPLGLQPPTAAPPQPNPPMSMPPPQAGPMPQPQGAGPIPQIGGSIPQIGGQMSLGQLMANLKRQNPGVPDMLLLNTAAKVSQILNPYDKQLLQFMLQQAGRNTITPYQQSELDLRQQSLANSRENAAETRALRLQMLQQNVDAKEAAKWSVQQDMGNGGHSFRYNVQTGEATELDGKTPYKPSGSVSKQASGSQPRSAPAMAMQKFMQEHPNATAEDISQFGASYGEKAKAARDFGTGALGNSIRSINTAVQHLETAKQAGDALGNNDVQALNKLKNSWAQQFGSPLPTNFDAIRQIVGQEVVKAIVAGGGGVSERQQAQEILSRANSPKQLAGAIDQIQKLMVGQLNSLRQQYQRTVGLDDFDQRFLMPETGKVMGSAGYEAQSAPSAGSGADNGGWKIERVE